MKFPTLPRPSEFRFRIDREKTVSVVDVPGSRLGEEIEVEPDMLPIRPHSEGGRTWGWFHLLGYWVAEAFGISQYQVASSSIAAGLSPGATIGAVALGHFLVALANAANGYVGCLYGINFPVFTRASFGQRGVYVALICRSVAAIVWAGTQTYQGGLCVQVMLQAIWPSFASFPNHLPLSANVTSSQLLCFFIFYIIQLPLLYIPMEKLRYLFMVKIVVMPIFGIALFGWAVGKAQGFGPIFSKPTNITTGVPAPVVFFTAMSSAIAPKATLALNIADFTRYAKSPRTVVWTNIVSLTVLVTLCAILGVVVTSAAEVIYGAATWNPLQVSVLMDRAPMFFSAFCWMLSVIATNISANTTAVANDLMMAFPKYINIRRGQYLCIIVALATTPWNIQNSAKSFSAFLSGYSLWLGPPCGVMLADYWFVRRRQLNLANLYRTGPGSEIFYTHGFNIRAIVAFVCGIVPTMPGFVRAVGGAKMGIAIEASYVYCCVWPVGVVVAGGVYILLNLAFPYRYAAHGSVVERVDSLSEKVEEAERGDEDKKY